MTSAQSALEAGPALLFCPADRPERYAKALDRADGVILDLEDAVAPTGKVAARELLHDFLRRSQSRVIVRVNAGGSPWFHDDIAMLRSVGHRAVMLPKASNPLELDRLSEFDVVALCETAAGVLSAGELARHPSCVALMWGGEDLIADLGGRRSRDDDGRYHEPVLWARSHVLLAAGAAGKRSIDAVHIDLADLSGLERESRGAVDVGFDAKACVHPDHVAVIRRAFRPGAVEVAWARRVVSSGTDGDGVRAVDGRMVDEPLLRQARRVLDQQTMSDTDE